MFAEMLPALNACLNALSFTFLVLGFVAIRRGNQTKHRKLMIGAFAASTVFLVFYLLRFYLTGTTRFERDDWTRGLYFFVLFTHMPLAMVVVPMVLRALWLAYKRRFAEHRRVTRWLYPMWAYVSVTGVLVYLLLYQLPGARG